MLQQMYGAFNPFAALTGVNPEAAEGEAKAGSAEGTTQVGLVGSDELRGRSP